MKHLLILSAAMLSAPMFTSCEDSAAKKCEENALNYSNAKVSYNIALGSENCTTAASAWADVVSAFNALCSEEKLVFSSSQQANQFVHTELLDEWGC
jgi:hypothetical protein